MKLHTSDTVLITQGKDKGQKGSVEKVIPLQERVVVQGKNLYKRFRKGFGGKPGSVVEYSRPIPFGNVALLCPKCGKQTRVGYSMTKNQDKSRICRKCGAVI